MGATGFEADRRPAPNRRGLRALQVFQPEQPALADRHATEAVRLAARRRRGPSCGKQSKAADVWEYVELARYLNLQRRGVLPENLSWAERTARRQTNQANLREQASILAYRLARLRGELPGHPAGPTKGR